MKIKTLGFFIAACSIATASFAQQEQPRTEVKTRDNGTQKITTVKANGSRTVTKTGKTNLGAAADNTKDAAGNVVTKAGSAVVKTGKKAGKAVKRGARKVGTGAKRVTRKAETTTE
ncbi:hypothetical protein [uncultured Hymenobacter sp.]|uniref:hypothetical protein n=1 Tax=uncultured Hymenobacter sp. TaxID=170016 RepID=UPI0035CB2118